MDKPSPQSAVDAYLAATQPFAQPILAFLREAVHRAVPGVEEEMKWSRPFFVYRGVILANMAGFKAHCSFGLWGREMAAVLAAGQQQEPGRHERDAMGSFGRITSIDDLPPLPVLGGYLRQAAELIGNGERPKSSQRVVKPVRSPLVLVLPEALAAALAAKPHVGEAFAVLSPSCRREYAEWIGAAKREDTQRRRVAEAVLSIAEGKGRNARYRGTKESGRKAPTAPEVARHPLRSPAPPAP